MKKTLIALATAATIAVTAIATPTKVEANSNGWWIPGAIIGGLAIGAIASGGYYGGYGPYYAPRPYYYGPGPYYYGGGPNYYGGGPYYGRRYYYGPRYYRAHRYRHYYYR
jgi:hypothetical protein